MKVIIETTVNENEIKQTTSIVWSLSDARQELSSQILNAKEEQLRKALIALGWTPPNENEEEAREIKKKPLIWDNERKKEREDRYREMYKRLGYKWIKGNQMMFSGAFGNYKELTEEDGWYTS